MASKKTSPTSETLSKAITSHIEELAKQADAAFLNEQMQAYLEMCAQFHHYSPNNVWLIMLACPHASAVAGFRKWKDMGRYVKKGEKGIPILAPMTRKQEKENGEAEKILTGFRVVYVFDISQTDGEPLPEPPEWKSPEKNAELTSHLIAFANQNGITVEIQELEGETQGVSKGGSIILSPEAGTKTLIHEIAHELMHQKENVFLAKGLKELEAEAVAYVVARHFGLDNLSSPNYVALYGADSELILQHMERIRRTAARIIKGVEMSL